MTKDEVRDGVELTNLDQPLFEGADATKRDLVDYLDAMSDRLVPQLRGPAAVGRAGAARAGPVHAEERPEVHAPWVRTVSYWAEKSKREVAYALCNDRPDAALVREPAGDRVPRHARSASRTTHHPTIWSWTSIRPRAPGSTPPSRRRGSCTPALDEAGLAGAVKTSGAKGVHIFVPIVATPVEEVAAATRALAARAERLDPGARDDRVRP